MHRHVAGVDVVQRPTFHQPTRNAQDEWTAVITVGLLGSRGISSLGRQSVYRSIRLGLQMSTHLNPTSLHGRIVAREGRVLVKYPGPLNLRQHAQTPVGSLDMPRKELDLDILKSCLGIPMGRPCSTHGLALSQVVKRESIPGVILGRARLDRVRILKFEMPISMVADKGKVAIDDPVTYPLPIKQSNYFRKSRSSIRFQYPQGLHNYSPSFVQGHHLALGLVEQ